MFCPECGINNEYGARVCEFCGAALKSESPDQGGRLVPEGFNWGAFFIPTIWLFGNGLWQYGILLLAIAIYHPFSLNIEPMGLFFFTALIFLRVGIAVFLGNDGNKIVWNTGFYKSIGKFRQTQRALTCLGTVIFGFQAILVISISTFIFYGMYQRDMSRYTPCEEYLKQIRMGMEKQISEKGSLEGIRGEDDICHHIIPGADSPEDCVGRIKERVDKPAYTICVPDTLKIRVLDGSRYEIKATARNKKKTPICVTESGIDPGKYGKKPRGCKH